LLRQELQQVEQAIAQQEAEAARQAEAADRSAQETAKSYRMAVSDYFKQLGISAEGSAAGAPDAQQTLQELAETLKQQQAAIDNLTQALEDLRAKFGELAPKPSEGRNEPGMEPSPADPGGAALNFIDERIRLRLRDPLSAPQADVDDATFLRRVMLDLTGILPTADQVRDFVDNSAPDKRRQLIEDLIQRGTTRLEEEPQPDSTETP
jgi:hypothetical protein